MTIEERFWNKVDKHGPIHPMLKTRCWLWMAGTRQGYGAFRETTKVIDAHRYSWKLETGKIPKKFVCHHCDIRRCVRFSHFFLGMHKENMRDCVAKGFNNPIGSPGEMNPAAKVTKKKAIIIRKMYASGNYSQQKIGNKFGITQAQVSMIVLGKVWR